MLLLWWHRSWAPPFLSEVNVGDGGRSISSPVVVIVVGRRFCSLMCCHCRWGWIEWFVIVEKMPQWEVHLQMSWRRKQGCRGIRKEESGSWWLRTYCNPSDGTRNSISKTNITFCLYVTITYKQQFSATLLFVQKYIFQVKEDTKRMLTMLDLYRSWV